MSDDSYSRENDPLTAGRLLTIREAARLVGCKPSVIYEARRNGQLAVYELGERRILVSRSDIAAWLASRRRAPTVRSNSIR